MNAYYDLYHSSLGKTKQHTVAYLNRFAEEGIVRKCGSGQTVAYLGGSEI